MSQIATWRSDSRVSLADALAPPVAACAELGVVVDTRGGVEEGISGWSLRLWLTSRTAYRCDPAGAIMTALKQRGIVGDDLLVRLRTALHEAIMNAVVHGNLGLSSVQRKDFDGVAALADRIERMMAKTNYSNLGIFIGLDWSDTLINVAVADQGPGYSVAQSRMLECNAYGRGLAIIRDVSENVSVTESGRRITMSFKR